jgi:hypothetical protein
MSVGVELEQLRSAIAAAGDAVFLLTVRDGVRPHAVSAIVSWDGDDLVTAATSRSSSNVATSSTVTLLWPASGQEYSLIVDGTATVDEAAGVLRITPTHAVQHRSVLASPASGHGDDAGDDPRCKPVLN